MTEVERLAEIIRASRRIVFFGGAGMSTESGIPDFRSSEGLYSKTLQKEKIEAIMETGLYAASGRGQQKPIVIAVTDKAMRDKLSKVNCEIGGWDPHSRHGWRKTLLFWLLMVLEIQFNFSIFTLKDISLGVSRPSNLMRYAPLSVLRLRISPSPMMRCLTLSPGAKAACFSVLSRFIHLLISRI